MIQQDAPLLDLETLQYEVSRVWKVLPDIIGKEEFVNEDINECVYRIFEALIYDYARDRAMKIPGEVLNYKLAEA
tara:strand:- start:295 stop:519 length:225 start_codon:yes stop_codon:yes gene_type:complete